MNRFLIASIAVLLLLTGCSAQKGPKTPTQSPGGMMQVIYQGPINRGSMPPIQSLWEVSDVGRGMTSGAVRFSLRLTLENEQVKTVVLSSMEATCEPFPKSRSLPGQITVDTTFSDGRHTHETDPARPEIWQGFQHVDGLKEMCRQAGIPFR